LAKALYRTYRSRSFDEVVGQKHITDLLDNAIKGGKIAHAYLLTGPKGVGKTSVARIIAHAVNELDYSENPHLDIIEIDAASNRRIDDIRDLREKVHIAPTSSKYKVYIIDEVHMLTGESFNALLKTLEEPPEHVIFILATTEVHKVPATIISRTQRYHFRPATNSDITKHLTSIAKKEKITFETEALERIAEHAGGSFRDSVSLLDQLSGLSEKITVELVESVLGMAERSRVESLVSAIEQHDLDTLITQLEAIQAAGVSPIVLTDQLNRLIAEHAKQNYAFYQLLDALTDVPKAHDPNLKLIATLVRFAKPTSHRTAASHVPKSPSFAAKPAELRTQAANRSAPAEQDGKKKSEPVATKQPAPAAAPSASAEFDWTKVLEAVKKHHAPLYSVVSRAQTEYDNVKQQLTLQFTYMLHRKKLENPTYRKQLGAVIRDVCGVEPVINVIDTKSSSKLDDNAKAVAAIMGGGEPVSGTI